MLHITSLKKTIGSFSLSIDDLQIRSPGIYGLIGHNGCGKSTLTKIISGIMESDSGKIDTDIDQMNITMITQRPYIMDDTVYNNLAYPLRLRRKFDKSLCDEYLEKIGFLERKNMRARGLSGGEKQKLALLRAMIFRPKLVILDESLSDLDLDSLDMFENMILKRQEEEPVIWIIISHQLAQIRRLCNYVFFMSNGRIEAEGSTEDLLSLSKDKPLNPSVSRFLKNEFLQTEKQ
ncbi:MAG: ATP-binding cassette domain-containing protein [Treponema sp.]|jgi:tungstate transport system ATP-binding protein|nr:ATP-binding cassette domain-containing protein [Treponema sp.]